MSRKAQNSSFYSIGTVSAQTDIGIETIRFYEKKGLLKTPARTPGGYRQYDDEAIQRLLFITRAKALGFTLKEISELLSLQLNSKSRCSDVKKKAQERLHDIDKRISSLQRMRKALNKLVRACDGQGRTDDCPILEALEKSGGHK